jgi:hypothetical protein
MQASIGTIPNIRMRKYKLPYTLKIAGSVVGKKKKNPKIY